MDNNNTTQKNKIQLILERIEKNEITLHSKTYFACKYGALILLALSVCVVSVFLSSFILFSMRVSGHLSLIGFEPNGWKVFFILFPWRLLALDILLIILLEHVLRRFRFGYKVSVLYLLVVVIISLALIDIVVDRLHLHDSMMRSQGAHRSTFAELYEDARRSSPSFEHGIFQATVTGIRDGGIEVDVDDPRKPTSTPLIILFSKIRSSTTSLIIGDRIFISGNMTDSEIQASHIRKARPFLGEAIQ